MRIFAIDPGPERSAFVVFEDGAVEYGKELPNDEMRYVFTEEADRSDLAIEMIACYGMAVGKETFETCRWIGRFEEQFLNYGGGSATLVYRMDVKMHLCKSAKAKDSNIRQALIDKHGPVGTKKNPGKLFGISGHLWAALAVADYVEANPA